MGRISDALIKNDTAHAKGHNATMIDLQYGGMFGFMPDYAEWVSNQAYVRRNLICLLVEAPGGFNYMPDPQVSVATLRALVELLPQSIDGLNATLDVEFGASNPVGGSGQMQEDFTDVKEAVSNPTFRIVEKVGMPVASFFRWWITGLMMDPNSKVANVATMQNKPMDLLSDMTAATMIFIEPDPTFTKVVKSWLCTNMMPKTSGEITGKKDQTQSMEGVVHDIPFTCIAQFGVGVDQFAQTLLDGLSITGANPQYRPAFVQAIDANVAAAGLNYKDNIAAQAAQAAIK